MFGIYFVKEKCLQIFMESGQPFCRFCCYRRKHLPMHKLIYSFLFTLLAFSLSAQGRANALVEDLRDVNSKNVLVVAHRGDWRNAPENSLQAFKNSDEVFGKNSDAADKAMMHDYITFIQNHIAQNYQQTITLNEMALLLHLSPPYLSSLFKRRLGCSFTEYLIRFRMNKAAELLRTTKMTVSEIAEDVGYPDSAQFSKIFKKYKGHAPRVYRTLAVSEPEAPAEATEAAQATDAAAATDEVRGKEAP